MKKGGTGKGDLFPLLDIFPEAVFCVFMPKAADEPINIIGKNYLRRQTLFVGFADLLAALFFYLVPESPFDRRLAPVLAAASAMYFCFFVWFECCVKYLHAIVIALSLAGLCVVAFVVHMSGGIASPLVCFYFALLVSEAGYGVTSPITVYAAVISYLCVVLGEAFGFLSVNNALSKAIYENHVVFVFIILTIAMHMIIASYISKQILRKLRSDFAEEQQQTQALLKRFSELDAHSHIGMLAHRMVHDLRNPLASISGYVELERLAPGKDSAQQAMLADLSETVTQISNTLTNITRFGRATESKKQRLFVKDFFNNLISIVSFSKDAAKVRFRRNYPQNRDFCVLAVRQDLQQAYFNILKNALETVKENAGDKTVEISMRSSAGMLEVEIANNGKPIPEEILGKIFKKAVTGKSGGTGVGLLITRDLLAKNDISIEIKNMEVEGVKVITKLPLCGNERQGGENG